MRRGWVLLAVVASLGSFGGMMRVKTDVQQLARERQRLAVEQLQLRETKRVLEAEYALLASPLRLETLARARGFVEMGILQMVDMRPDEHVMLAQAARAPPAVQISGAVVISASGLPVREVRDGQ